MRRARCRRVLTVSGCRFSIAAMARMQDGWVALGAFDAEHVELALDITEDEVGSGHRLSHNEANKVHICQNEFAIRIAFVGADSRLRNNNRSAGHLQDSFGRKWLRWYIRLN
jgi:hypothetical protein